MAKEVQKISSKNLKLYIIKTIQEKKRLPSDIKKNCCNYHLKPFLKAGLIIKKGYGVWDLTAKGEKLLNLKELQTLSLGTSFVAGNLNRKKTIRGHGFMWSIKLPSRAYFSIDKRVRCLKRAGFVSALLKTKQVKTKIRDHNIHLGLRTITIYFNPDISYFGNSASESYREACFELTKLIVILEKVYCTNLKIRGKHKFRICKNHYGDLNNDLAKYYKRNNQFVRIFDSGKEWLVIDFSSKEFIETETTSDRSKYDMDYIITPFMNKLHSEPKILDRLEDENKRLMTLLEEQQYMIQKLIIKAENNYNTFKY